MNNIADLVLLKMNRDSYNLNKIFELSTTILSSMSDDTKYIIISIQYNIFQRLKIQIMQL